MKPFYFLHITGGALAIAGGYAALFARKGGPLHRTAGILFVYAMLVTGVGAAVLGIARGKYVTALGGPLVVYLVVTATATVRPTTENSRRLARGLAALALALAAAFIIVGVAMIATATASIDGGVAAPPIFMNGMVALSGYAGDMRVLRLGALSGKPRLRRHLWRMCFATFVASGSFFLGQMRVIPKPLRIFPLLAGLAILPLIAMVYWLWRTRARGGRAGRALFGAAHGLPTSTSG